MIKIRYKYTESVIKKLVKLGLRDAKVLENPLRIFLKGGALHDLIGILFVCSYPYEREWVARALYNFFEYDHRTDDHLLYGFYTVTKESGYRALHCDRTLFNPRFDPRFSFLNRDVDASAEAIFSLLAPDDNDTVVVQKLKDYFNIEIQLHTTLENTWAAMEHAKSYNVLAKGSGRSSEISVQWNMLSGALNNLEMAFQRLQIDTEQSQVKDIKRQGFTFVYNIIKKLDKAAYRRLAESVEKVQNLRNLFSSHEFSRHDYVQQLQREVQSIDEFARKQENITVRTIFRMQSAFIYYGLANHSDFFNLYDIRAFTQRALSYYEENQKFLNTHSDIYKRDLVHVITIVRYLRLGEKYGLGLINPTRVATRAEDAPVLRYDKAIYHFELGLSLLNRLSEEDLSCLKEDNAAYVKIIHRFDAMAREWELFSSEGDSDSSKKIAALIQKFRERFITRALLAHFQTLLRSNKIKNVGFIVNFYATLIWHGLYLPLDSLKRIIKYSAYDRIDKSDLFYYELAAYRFLVVRRCEALKDCEGKRLSGRYDRIKIAHFRNYHSENMINLLFQIKRQESLYTFEKARIQFEQLTGVVFKFDHFSDSLSQ
ncbi:MAG TPA: hypothetical protein ENL02_02725 [Epsilonproteobacteria bacterium]|nr:hypothetical protein [Campylobacterota bacterium]